MTPQDTITELNGLIQTCKDGELGYTPAATHVRNTELETVFASARRSAAGSRRRCMSRWSGWAAILRIPARPAARCCGVGWS